MKFWKEHMPLRLLLIAVFFLVGLSLVIFGWTMKGSLTGLGIMIVGLILLVAALMIYNAYYK